MIAISAPSFAKATDTARPIPLSPPVINATRPSSLPLGRRAGSSNRGRGTIVSSMPGWRGWDWGGRAGRLGAVFWGMSASRQFRFPLLRPRAAPEQRNREPEDVEEERGHGGGDRGEIG